MSAAEVRQPFTVRRRSIRCTHDRLRRRSSHDPHAIAAGCGRDSDLGVAVVGMAPSSTFKKAVRGSDLTEGNSTGQIAARIDHPAGTLAHIQSPSARVLARGRTMPGADTVHEQHASAMVIFQIIDVGLETRSVADANARFCTCLERYDDAYSFVPIGIKPWCVPRSGGCRRLGSLVSADGRCRRRAESRAVAIVVALRRQLHMFLYHRILTTRSARWRITVELRFEN